MTKKALIVVDMQNDFITGSLAVPGAERVINPVRHCIDVFERAGDIICFSMDWHTPDHGSFLPYGGQWPIHCVNGTVGAAITDRVSIPPKSKLILKGQQSEAYSAFQGVIGANLDLASFLSLFEVTEVHVVGLALDFCVKATALDAATNGFKTIVYRDATAAVFPDNVAEVEKTFAEEGILLI